MITPDDAEPEARNRWLAVYVTALEEELADTKNTAFKCAKATERDVGLVMSLIGA